MSTADRIAQQRQGTTHESVYQRFVKRFAEKVAKIRIGDLTRRDVDMGPLVSESQRNRVEDMVKSGKDQGAKLVMGGCALSSKVHSMPDSSIDRPSSPTWSRT